jgi:hypothetical protein
VIGVRRERLEAELHALSDSGYDYEILSGSPEGPEELHLRVSFQKDGEAIPLDVHFPVLYPYFRFQVDAPSLALTHHQNPLQHNLCLLGRGTRNWSLRYTLADFLATQIPRAIDAGRETDPSKVREVEDIQAEPVSNYYPSIPDGLIGIDGRWLIPEDCGSGYVALGFRHDPPAMPPRAMILEVTDASGTLLAEADRSLCETFRYTRRGFWARLGAPPKTEDASEFLAKIVEVHADKGTQKRQGAKGGSFRCGFALFPEEHAWRAKGSGVGWLSVFEWRPTGRGNLLRGRVGSSACFVRVLRVGREDFRQRIPAAAALWNKKVVVVGVGCLGAPIAHALAQAGVGELTLLDHDALDPATTVRWPLGIPYWGMPKVDALRDFLSENFPLTSVRAIPISIGSVRRSDSIDELERLEEALTGAALVVDATAEHGVQRFLSATTRERSVSYVWAAGTWGGWGGTVGRVTPTDDACWCCVERAVALGAVMPPSADPDGALQPVGCGDITFTGLGFDMQEVSLQACRVGLGALHESEGHYPRSAENCFTLRIQGQEGVQPLPAWQGCVVGKDTACPVCGGG